MLAVTALTFKNNERKLWRQRKLYNWKRTHGAPKETWLICIIMNTYVLLRRLAHAVPRHGETLKWFVPGLWTSCRSADDFALSGMTGKYITTKEQPKPIPLTVLWEFSRAHLFPRSDTAVKTATATNVDGWVMKWRTYPSATIYLEMKWAYLCT